MIKQNNLCTRGAYVAPKCKAFAMRSAGGIMILSGGINYSDTAGGAGGNDSYDDSGSF